MRKLLVLLALVWAGPVLAQNTTCSNRPATDYSNACANTRFTTDAIAAAINGAAPVPFSTTVAGIVNASGSAAKFIRGDNTAQFTPGQQLPALTLLANLGGSVADGTGAAPSAVLDAAFGSSQGSLLCRGPSGWNLITLGFLNQSLTITTSGQCPTWTTSASSQPRASTRQTVQGGPQSNGLPSFLPTTSGSLSLSSQNLGTGVNALTVSAAVGTNTTGQSDLAVQFTSNVSWTGLAGAQTISGSSCTTSACTETTSTAHGLVVGATVTLSGCSSAFLNGTFVVATVPSSTTYTVNGPNANGTAFASATPTGCAYTVSNFLNVNASTGATGSSQLAPIYQYGGAISTVAGQFTFDISQMTGYLGNGTTAPATPFVFVGKAVTNASGVTSSVAYAYNGIYYVSQATLAAATVYTFAHNLGVSDLIVSAWMQNKIAEAGYSVGDRTNLDFAYVSPNYWGTTFTTTTEGIVFTVAAGGILLHNKTGFNAGGLTAANWSLGAIVRRSWGGA